jgi:hypothetical protein
MTARFQASEIEVSDDVLLADVPEDVGELVGQAQSQRPLVDRLGGRPGFR